MNVQFVYNDDSLVNSKFSNFTVDEKNADNFHGNNEFNVIQSNEKLLNVSNNFVDKSLREREVIVTEEEKYDNDLLNLLEQKIPSTMWDFNKMLNLLDLKLSNVPGKGDCGPWAILHSAFPNLSIRHNTEKRVDDVLTAWDLQNLRNKASSIAKKRGYEKAEELKTKGYSLWTYELIYFASVLNRSILCFNNLQNDIYVMYNGADMVYKTIATNMENPKSNSMISKIFDNYDRIIADDKLKQATKRLIKQYYKNPIMVYIGNNHFQSLVSR